MYSRCDAKCASPEETATRSAVRYNYVESNSKVTSMPLDKIFVLKHVVIIIAKSCLLAGPT